MAATVPNGGRLRGAPVHFEKITVTGTENIMMAAALADGETVLTNAALEPEIVDLADLLRKMGANISGDGTDTIRISGVPKLHGATHTVIPDRIEAGTFLIAGAITGGDLELIGCEPEHLDRDHQQAAERREWRSFATVPQGLRVRVHGELKSADVTTDEYPGFATDMQAQYMALATQAEGTSVITETIFENRFMHAAKCCAWAPTSKSTAAAPSVHGPSKLQGTTVIASDLRASASLVLAALVASGETIIDRVYHIDRGYEQIDEKLSAVGASIQRAR